MVGVGSLVWLRSAAARRAVVSGSDGMVVVDVAKSKQPVRSPQILRRQAEMLVSRTPVQASRNRSTEVWSWTWEFTQPPWLHGDTTVIGTRGPSPMGVGGPNAGGSPS